MARPPKKGIDYAGWRTNIFDFDEEENQQIARLIEAQGIAAFTVYFFLSQRACSANGYYLIWGYDKSASVAMLMGKGCSAAFVRSVVEYCLQIGLFDKGLFEEHGVLTGVDIQERYWAVKKSRDRNEAPTLYWLLGPEDGENAEGFIPHTQNENFTPPKPPFHPTEMPEKKKEKMNKNMNTRLLRGAYQNVDITDEQYAELAKVIPGIDSYLDTFSEKLYFKKYRYADHYKAILEWWERDKATRKPVKKAAGSGSFDVSDFLSKAIKKGYGK